MAISQHGCSAISYCSNLLLSLHHGFVTTFFLSYLWGGRLPHPMGAVWRFGPPPIPSILIHVFCSCCHSTKSMFTSIVSNLSFVISHPYNYCIKLVICNKWPIQSITGFVSWSGSFKKVLAACTLERAKGL